MTTYVLVHGAWGGSYGFRATRRLLQAEGHEVFTPSLTGIGERVHLASPVIDLSTHVADVVNTFIYEDLTDVVLLGFSYGGMVVTGTLDTIADRVRHLVYLDAFVPDDGQSTVDLIGGSMEIHGLGVDGFVPPQPREYEDPVAGAFSEARRVPHPKGTFAEPVRVSKPVEDFGIPLTYVKATADVRTEPPDAFWRAADRARVSEAWSYAEIDTSHMIPIDRPGELAALLRPLG